MTIMLPNKRVEVRESTMAYVEVGHYKPETSYARDVARRRWPGDL
jgi:DNA-binding XRE family transcriptional regulator